MAWRPSKLAIAAWVALAGVVVMQRAHVAPISNVLAAAIYFIVWWVFLFAVLPFGVRTQSDTGEVVQGTIASAPVVHRMGRVIALTTIVAALAFTAIVLALRFNLVPLG